MRGRCNPQASMLAFIDPEERIPLEHPMPSKASISSR
jgi:hypothetical protein